jgi:dihydroxyacetone kinase
MSRLSQVVTGVARAVTAAADELNSLDGYAGDGDLGVTMTSAATALIAAAEGLKDAPLPAILRDCGTTIARSAPSTSGTLIAIGLLRAAQQAADNPVDKPAAFAELLAATTQAIEERGGASAGAKTMVDALSPAVNAARNSAASGSTLAEVLADAALAADAGARSTVSMRPRFGRAAWLAERGLGHEDAGARLIAIALQAAANSFDNEGRASASPGPARDPEK